MNRAREIVVAALMAILLAASIGAAPWGYKIINKGLIDQSLSFPKDPQVIWVRAWEAPVTLSFWTSDGDRVVPEMKSSDNDLPAWADGDTVMTVAPGDWAPIKCDGKHVRRIYIKTLNAYSTYDSNATAVSIDVE